MLIIVDEVYEDVVFDEDRLFLLIVVFSGRVFVMVVSALSKRWFAFGWRIGWFVFYDYDYIL